MSGQRPVGDALGDRALQRQRLARSRRCRDRRDARRGSPASVAFGRGAEAAGWSVEHANVFQDGDVVASYEHRPPYPQETIAALAASPRSPAVAPCGGRPRHRRACAATRATLRRVDAADVVCADARARTNAARRGARAVGARRDRGPPKLTPPYALVVAGDSVHWLDWDVALPRICELAPRLAAVTRDWLARRRAASRRLRPIYGRRTAGTSTSSRRSAREPSAAGLRGGVERLESPPPAGRRTLDEIVSSATSRRAASRARGSRSGSSVRARPRVGVRPSRAALGPRRRATAPIVRSASTL